METEALRATGLKVVHFNVVDQIGGAAKAAFRLHRALKDQGIVSRMLVRDKTQPAEDVAGLPQKTLTQINRTFVDAMVDTRRSSLSNTAFLPNHWTESALEHPWVQEADVLHFHAVDGLLSNSSIGEFLRLGKPVIWTLHDEWAFTGGCHYTSGCTKYQSECAECPQLQDDPAAMVRSVFRKKLLTWSVLPDRIVTPSRWLAECASQSRIFRGVKTSVVPYGIDLSRWAPSNTEALRAQLKIPKDAFVCLFVAEQVSDRRKGWKELQQALEKVVQKAPHLTDRLYFLKIGREAETNFSKKVRYTNLGCITDETLLAKVYSLADVYLLPTLEDNLPNTILESFACGTPIIGFETGGLPDFIQAGSTGWLVEQGDVAGFADAIIRCAETEDFTESGLRCRQLAEAEFAESVQAIRYAGIYREVMAQPKMLSPEPESAVEVTIVTATLNAADSIGDTVTSVRRQTLAEWELLVMDGGSTDETVSRLRSLNDPRIRISSGPDAGIYDAMNKGIHLARGRLIYFLNAGDCLFDEDVLQDSTRAMRSHESLDVLYSDHYGLNKDGSRGFSRKPAPVPVSWFRQSNFCHQSMFFRREAFDQVGLYSLDFTLLSDFDWNLRAMIGGLQFGYLPRPSCLFDNAGRHTSEENACVVRDERARIESLYLDKLPVNFVFPVQALPPSSANSSSPAKVVFAMHGPNQMNGPNIWLLRLLPDLVRRGFEVHILGFMTSSADCKFVQALSVAWVRCKLLPFDFTEKSVVAVLEYLREINCDVFVPHLNVPSYFASKWVKEAGIPTVGVIHSDDPFHRDLLEVFGDDKVWGGLSDIVAVSSLLEGKAREKAKGSIRIHRIPCGAPVPGKVATFSAKPFRLVYAGRFVEEQKQITKTLLALIKVAGLRPNVEAVLCGSGPQAGTMKEIIRQAGMSDRIFIRESLDQKQMEKVFLRSQVFVLLSDYEGLPISLQEAMACGVVPVCKKVESGVGELVIDGETGFLCRNRDEDFVAKTLQLVDDPTLWKAFSTRARAHIERCFSSSHNAESWAKLIADLAKSKRENPSAGLTAIPHSDHLDLPPPTSDPAGILREDRRNFAAFHSFLHPACTPNNADLFWQRKSILEAVRAAKPLLEGTFLDVGCGVMPYRQMLTDEGSRIKRYIGMDIETEIYRADVDLRWDGKKIPLEDASIDSAMATEVLEHCPEPLTVLKEIRRVLKPGGVFFFTVPYIWPLHDAPYDYWRYTPFSLKKLLGEAGFADVDVKALSGWNASLAQMMGLWLKRAPMSAERRKEMAQKLWPLYQELVTTDQLPSDPEAGNTMATGWSGLAFAGKAVGRESSPPEVEAAELPLVIARSHEKNYSETFIQDHVDTISARCLDLSGWPFPRFVNGRSILDETDEAALIDAIQHQKPVSEATSRAYVAGVAKWLEQSGAQVALLESGLMGAFLYPACEKAGIPYVVHFHGVDAWKADLLQAWKAKYDRFFRGAAGVIGVSREMVEQLRKLGAPEERLVHAPYGVSVAVERLAEPQTAPPVFVAVGRFVEKKAPQKTLQAFAAMRGKVPEARLVMVGDGPLLSDCRKWVAQQGLEDAVAFTGVLSRRAVSRLLSTARAFVQHSVAAEDGDREGLPLAILEAGAHGLPVVATRHAGIPDAVREEQDGLLVDEGDIKGMAVAMWKLAAQPELAGKMGSSFRERVTAHYSRKVSIERLQNILYCAAEGRPVKEALSGEDKPAETVKPAPAAGSAIAAKLAEGREALKNGETAAAVTAFEAAISRDRNCGEALVQLGSLAAGQGDYETAYLYLKEAQRVGALPEGAEPTLRALEGNSELQTDVVRAYQERIGMGGMGRTERPRRILVFTNLLPPQEMGGFGRTVWEFCDGLLQRGHDVRILTADLPELQQQPYADYERVERHVKRNLRLFGDWQGGAARQVEDQKEIQRIALHDVRTILQEVKTFRPDLCMAGNLDFLSGAMLDPILEQGIPVVHRLGNASPGYAADATPKSELYCIAGCSNWVNRQLQENGYAAMNFAVLPAGAPLHEYYRAMPPAMDQLRVCYAGLIMAYKGPHLLVQALGMLKKIGVPFRCEFAGDTKDPQYFAQLKALVRQNGIEEQVRFLGFQDRAGLAAMFARNNTLVFPSVFQEPFGKVQIEAQAAGLAVVRSAVGGYEDMLEDEANGLLFRGEDAEDLARQLYVLQGDKELWAKIAAQGQVDAFRFRTRNCVELLEEIMEALLRSASGASEG